MADDDALFQKGMPIRREVLGPEYVDASMARADEFMMSFQRATTAWVRQSTSRRFAPVLSFWVCGVTQRTAGNDPLGLY